MDAHTASAMYDLVGDAAGRVEQEISKLQVTIEVEEFEAPMTYDADTGLRDFVYDSDMHRINAYIERKEVLEKILEKLHEAVNLSEELVAIKDPA